ncbi:hypothetical protein NPIL_277701, partial [Nephila pilipes]
MDDTLSVLRGDKWTAVNGDEEFLLLAVDSPRRQRNDDHQYQDKAL